MARAPETPEIELKEETFIFPVRTPLPAGSEVFLQGNFDAVFGTSNPADRHRGWVPMRMGQVGADYVLTVPNLEVGQTYEYQFIVKTPGRPDRYYPAAGRNYPRKIEPAEKTADSDVLTGKERARIGADIRAVLDAVTTGKKIAGADSAREKLRLDLEHKRGDRQKILLAALASQISAMKQIPSSIREEFSPDNPLAHWSDFEDRVRRGARVYRDKVRAKLLSDNKTREALHAHNNHFSSDVDQAINRICNEFDMLESLPYLLRAFSSLDQEPAVDPTIAADLARLRKAVEHRIHAHETHGGGAPPERKSWATNIGIQALSWGLIATGGGAGVGVGILGVKAFAELLGINARDFFEAKRGHRWSGVLKKIRKNNVGNRWWTSKSGEGGKTILRRLGEIALHALPGSALFIGGRSVGGVLEGAGGSHGGEHGEEHGEEHVNIDDVIRKACREELG